MKSVCTKKKFGNFDFFIIYKFTKNLAVSNTKVAKIIFGANSQILAILRTPYCGCQAIIIFLHLLIKRSISFQG